MTDLISRQAVFETIDDCNSDGLKGIFCSYDDGERFKEYIKKLPSAQPERKKGKWINRSLNILYPEWERYTCSVCGEHSNRYDYCPNCGAKMDEEKENTHD